MKFAIFIFVLLLNFAYAPLKAEDTDVYENDNVEITDESEFISEDGEEYIDDDNGSIFNDKGNGEKDDSEHDDDKELSMHSSSPVSL